MEFALAAIPLTPTGIISYAVSAAKNRGLNGIYSINGTFVTGKVAQALCDNTFAAVGSVAMTCRYPLLAFIPLPANLRA